jgi:superfamily II DNA or RNA helicase
MMDVTEIRKKTGLLAQHPHPLPMSIYNNVAYGMRIHENTKVELEVYARENGKAIVKPFMLVIARDTGHADAQKAIEDETFFEGRYKGKVIQVHSKQTGEERDETVEQLINVEKPDNPTEIVIHVNMLKEGWDVTNLYTIVPLRAANSKTLVEQSIGRGLRLPYGKRTDVGVVDRLTIVSHDKFQEIVDAKQHRLGHPGQRRSSMSDERSKVVWWRTGDHERIAFGRATMAGSTG